jgi:peptide/nickel transport system permease protein
MGGYIVRRIVSVIPVMGIVAIFVFSLLYLAPGDPAALIAGELATADQIEAIRREMGLDQPYVVRFGEWVLRILQGDFGQSIFTNRR